MSRRSTLLMLSMVLLGVAACRPKDVMSPVDFEALDPNARTTSETTQTPPWGIVEPSVLSSKLGLIFLQEPSTSKMHLRLMAAVPPNQGAASTLVVAYTARDLVRKNLELSGARVRVVFGADRLELVVSGSAADAPEILRTLDETLARPPLPRQFASSRGRLIGQLPRPDTAALAIAAATATILDRPLDTQLVTPEALRTLEMNDLKDAWKRTFATGRSVLMVHADVERAEVTELLTTFGESWSRKIGLGALLRPMGDVIDALRGSEKKLRERRTRLSSERSGPIAEVPLLSEDTHGRPTLVVARLLSLPTTRDRAMARLAQRHLQTTVDARLSIEGAYGVWLYRISLDRRDPGRSLRREMSRIEEQVQRVPQRWELEQAASLWLGARLVHASLDGEDWTAMMSQAISLSVADAEISSSLDRDAIAMKSATTEELHEWMTRDLLPSRDDLTWRWHVVGVEARALDHASGDAPSP